jgi:ribonuclease-3
MSDVAAFVRDRLGHAPKDIHLFELALSHKSLGKGEDYERLEFLGDRVLGHVMARALYDRHPKEPEGYLSRRYNVLVARETCADIGRELGVPEMVRLGKQAREDGATQSENVIGDVVESLIGALLIDGGFEAAQRFILDTWESHLSEQRKAPQHPKSALQELAAAKGLKAPLYEVVGRAGAHHAPKFTIRVSVAKLGEATAEGTSKQEAETAAAEALLAELSRSA